MRFFIQYNTNKRILTATSYQQLVDDTGKLFDLDPQSISLLYIDMSGAGEISISSQDDFIEMTQDIEDV